MFQKLMASVLALACVLSLNVTAFAAATPSPGDLVDGDGNKAMNSSQNVKPGDDYYYIIGRSDLGYDTYTNRDNFSFNLKKIEGGKNISGGTLLEKKFNGVRFVCIQFTIKDSYSSSEYKLVLEAQFRARKDMVAVSGSESALFPIFVPGTGGGSSGVTTPEKIAAAKLVWENAKTAASTAKTAVTNMETATANAEAAYNDSAAVDAGSIDAKKKEVARLGGLVVVAQAKYDTDNAAFLEAKGKYEQAETTKNAAIAAITAANKLLTETLEPQALAIGAVVTAFDAQGADNVSVNIPIAAYNTVYTPKLDVLVDTSVLATEKPKYELVQTTVSQSVTDTKKIVTDNKAASEVDNATLLNDMNTKEGAKNTANSELAQANKNLTDYQNAPASRATNTNTDALKLRWENFRGVQLPNAQKALTDANNLVATTLKLYNDELAKVPGTGYLLAGQTKPTQFSVWIQNEQRTDSDATIVVGEKGVVIRPEKNERNTVTWESGNGITVARITFTADSSASFYCPTLSTKMDSRADYYDYFDDRDAYMFNFVDNPRIPATTRASLSLYNPFIDRYGESDVDVRDLYVYQLVDGELTNVTDKFTPEENDDGDDVLTTRTITLGTYIVTDHSVRLIDHNKPARPNDNIDTEILYPSGNKPIPNTGR